jgi:hypothetical protein
MHAGYLSNPAITVAEEFLSEYAINTKILMNAYAYRVLNQGMYSKGLSVFMSECSTLFSRQWNDLLLQTDQWQKGSSLILILDEAGNDRFLGYRTRLYTKFIFVLMFLYRSRDILIEKLSSLALNDPIHKIKYRIRPSQFDKITTNQEMDYLIEKSNNESQLQEIFTKISQWNTYFGIGASSSPLHSSHMIASSGEDGNGPLLSITEEENMKGSLSQKKGVSFSNKSGDDNDDF